MKYLIILLFLFVTTVKMKAQNFNNSIQFGVKYYVFNDWGFEYLRPSFFAIQYTRAISKKYSASIDADFFDINTRSIDRRLGRLERLKASYLKGKANIRYFQSVGVSLNSKITKNLYVAGGMRFRYVSQFVLEDYIVHNPISTTIREESYALHGLGLEGGLAYDWTFFKRIVLKLDISAQFFYRKPYMQHQLGLFLGYKFGK